jgi:hypothetical protein
VKIILKILTTGRADYSVTTMENKIFILRDPEITNCMEQSIT